MEPGAGAPKGAQESSDEPKASSSTLPPATEPGEAARPGKGGRWGFLPLRVQDAVRVANTDEMPFVYRDWIDGYYRRLARER